MINDVCVIIPAYNPEEKLFIGFAKELIQKFSKILVVNDGSKRECDFIFEEIKKLNIKVIKHNVNLGKGRALKTAFNEVLNSFPECIGSVCADCDGQHSVQDIIKCAEKLKQNPNNLILGSRDFNQSNIPSKSRYGNKLTRTIFKIFIGLNIQDTQTGLRAMGKELMKLFMNIKGERYEYETNMLIECKNKNIKIDEVTISTIYIEKNKGSHFNPIKDSFSIYKMFGKYIFSSVSSFFVDIILFNIALILLNKCDIKNSIIIATIIARTVSSLYNFFINGKIVFKNITKKALVKYIILVIVQMFISAFTVQYLSKIITVNVVVIKVLVDFVIFMVNFVVQREFVFNK